jgi:hypothetical protein
MSTTTVMSSFCGASPRNWSTAVTSAATICSAVRPAWAASTAVSRSTVNWSRAGFSAS